jgi:putative N6-adenine-specific DNA methylase
LFTGLTGDLTEGCVSDEIPLIAVTGFGLEAIVARELRSLGYAQQTVEDGRVRFMGDVEAIVRSNLWLRVADRVVVEVGVFEAHDFGELFDRTRDLPWEDWIPKNAQFPVTGRSIKSQLHSVPDCQRIVKKAIVERLKPVHGNVWLEETGPLYSVEVALRKDRATLTIDASGAGLHKRGYRKLTAKAPLRETLAAALVQLSVWNAQRAFVDPLCGSGTIPIEAALIATNRAPGLHRKFACSEWPQISPTIWAQATAEAKDLIVPGPEQPLIGTDVDGEVLSTARYHASQAGVAECVHFQKRPFAEFSSKHKYGCVITNPPYGERMGELEDVEQLYREMGRRLGAHETWSAFVLTSHQQFERLFGRKATRRRKLYNARLACNYYQFLGPRPPRPETPVEPQT